MTRIYTGRNKKKKKMDAIYDDPARVCCYNINLGSYTAHHAKIFITAHLLYYYTAGRLPYRKLTENRYNTIKYVVYCGQTDYAVFYAIYVADGRVCAFLFTFFETRINYNHIQQFNCSCIVVG